MTAPDTRHPLRRTLRQQRAALTPRAQRLAAEQLARQLGHQLWFQRARHLGLYLPVAGELNPLPAVTRHWPRGKHLYLPVIRTYPAVSISMRPWLPGEQLLTNQYGIGEPLSAPDSQRPLWALDVLLVPLVAFDRQGNRLGMGGGFYDRLLASLAGRPQRPRLVGLGYGFQEVEHLEQASWDEPLDLIVTERELIECRTAGVIGRA